MSKLNKSVSALLFATALCPTAQVIAAAGNSQNAIEASAQQESTVSGTVSDAMGPVIGASVVVKGTTNGTMTDLDGNYTLEAPKGAVLVFSYVGYVSKEIVYNGQAVLNAELSEDVQKLDEVVVTALGLKRAEKALGYAVTEMKGDDLKGANSVNPVAALQGKVAGVEISGSDGGLFGANKIQIRGASTLNGNNQPIYVVDGVILDNGTSGNTDLDWTADSGDYGNELKNLNPDDFETVSVLKGAAATALYGSRGLNGAVVITTKGGGQQKGFGIAVSQTFGVDHVFKTPDIQSTYGEGYWAGRNNFSSNRWDNPSFGTRNNVESLIPMTSIGMAWGPKYDGRAIELNDYTMGTYSAYKNNMKDMYQLGFNTNTNVSVRGGNDKTSFYTSASYKKANSTTPNNTFERLSLLLKGSHKISERVNIAASVSIANSTPRNAARSVGEQFVNGNISQSYNTDYYKDKYLGEHGGIASSSFGDAYQNVQGKSYWFKLNHYDYQQNETVVRPTAELNVKVTDWMNFKADANMNYYYNRIEDKQLGDGYANEGGYYAMGQVTKEQVTAGGTFTFNKQVKDFSLGGFARFEYFQNKQANYRVETDGGLIVPGQFFIGNSKKQVIGKASISDTKHMMSAIFALNAGWKNQLFLDVTGRNDWSSSLVYTNATGNFSYFYPSVSGSWLLSETFQMPSWISFGKIRASWAQVGNDTSPYAINQGYEVGNIVTSNGNIYYNTVTKQLFDKNLRPERKNAFEVGIDWRFLNSRINLDATYYKENTTDQIISIAVPYQSGVESQLINAGNIQNQGVEIALNTVPFRNKDWEWTLDFTYTKNDNKIIELHPNVTSYIKLAGEPNAYDYRIGSVAMVGGSYGVLMSDIMPARNENGEIILNWKEHDRAAYPARSNEVQVVGKMTPDFLGSVSTGLKWKNLSMRVALDMRFGGMVASYNNRYGLSYGYTGTSMQYRDADNGGLSWISKYEDSNNIAYNDGVIPQGVFASGTIVTGVDGKKHDVGGQSYASLVEQGILEPTHAGAYHYWSNAWGTGTINDDWVSEVNYIALREISLSYKVPQNIASKLKAKNLNVGFSARNLGYLYNSLPNNLHPETVRGNQSGEFRIRAYDPYTASYSFSVGMEF